MSSSAQSMFWWKKQSSQRGLRALRAFAGAAAVLLPLLLPLLH